MYIILVISWNYLDTKPRWNVPIVQSTDVDHKSELTKHDMKGKQIHLGMKYDTHSHIIPKYLSFVPRESN